MCAFPGRAREPYGRRGDFSFACNEDSERETRWGALVDRSLFRPRQRRRSRRSFRSPRRFRFRSRRSPSRIRHRSAPWASRSLRRSSRRIRRNQCRSRGRFRQRPPSTSGTSVTFSALVAVSELRQIFGGTGAGERSARVAIQEDVAPGVDHDAPCGPCHGKVGDFRRAARANTHGPFWRQDRSRRHRRPHPSPRLSSSVKPVNWDSYLNSPPLS